MVVCFQQINKFVVDYVNVVVILKVVILKDCITTGTKGSENGHCGYEEEEECCVEGARIVCSCGP